MNHNPFVVLSTAYLGPVEYFAYIINAKRILIEQEETYLKQTYRNRCVIDSSEDKLVLSIPVVKVNGNHTKIKDIRISNDEKWQLIHWRAITSSYNHSPFFLYYKDELEPFFLNKFNFLLDYNQRLLSTLLKFISHDVSIDFTSKFEKPESNGNADLRYSIRPKIKPVCEFPRYPQVFENKHGFIPNLSIIDLLFNLGPDAKEYLNQFFVLNNKSEQFD